MAPRKIAPGGIVDIMGPLPTRQKPVRGTFVGPLQPRDQLYAGGLSGGVTTGELVVDLTPALNRISHVFGEASKLIGERSTNSALFRAINYSTSGAYARIVRDLRNQSGASLSRIKKAVVETKATPASLQWKLKASDKPIALIDFATSARPGAKNPSANPWNRSQRFKHAFVIGPGGTGRRSTRGGAHGMQIVKASDGPGHAHPRSGPLNAKVLWGPIIPKEMLRKGTPSMQDLGTNIPRVFERRLLHELEQAIAKAIG